MLSQAELTVGASTLTEAREQVDPLFVEYFGTRPWVIIDEDARAIVSMAGKILIWEVRFLAKVQ